MKRCFEISFVAVTTVALQEGGLADLLPLPAVDVIFLPFSS
jgi:hypothetical protein